MAQTNHLKTLLAILAIVVAIAISYANTINAPFVFDDHLNITENRFIKISGLQLKELTMAATNGQSKHRWVPNLSFAVQYYFSALDPAPYHLFNITVHVLCAAVLYLLVLATLDHAGDDFARTVKYEVALVTAMLWGLHPLQTNAVTYLVQRMTSLSSLFYLVAVLLYAKARMVGQPASRKYLLFSACLISGLLAVASKEIAAMLPLTLIAYEFFFISQDTLFADRRRAAAILGGACLVLLILGGLWVGRDIFQQILQGYQGRYFSLSERLLTEPRVIFFYLGLFFFPALSSLNINHDIALSTSLFSPATTILAIGGLLLMAYSVRHLFNKERVLSFAILWFLLNLAIESSIIPLELCFEHRMYLPSTILTLAVVLLIYRAGRRHLRILRVAFAILAVILGTLTWNRNLVWQSALSLWSDTVAKSPNLIRPYINLGNALWADNQLAQAESCLLKALAVDAARKIDHNHPAWKFEMSGVHDSLSVVYRKQKNFTKAGYHSEEALRLDPGSVGGLLTRGILLTEAGKYQDAEVIFRRLSAGGDDSVDLANNWGICAHNLGETDRAIFLFRHALKLNPNHAESHYNLGIAYSAKGMNEEARQEMLLGMGQ